MHNKKPEPNIKLKNEPLQILVSVYACGPNWGSEVGMGWNWVINLSNHCKLMVITESAFKNEIEEKLMQLNLKYTPKFYYLDIGEKGRKLFWKQGSYRFYKYYRRWQKKALHLAKNIIKNNTVHLIHQLNMIGYREPGYLWKINGIPYIIGPLGGYNQFPTAFFSELNFRDKLFYLARNLINTYQKKFLKRHHKAYQRAESTLLATPNGFDIVSRYSQKKPIIINETGAYKTTLSSKPKSRDETLKISWVGLIAGRKALSLALKAVARSKFRDQITLAIVGSGPNLEANKKLARRLKLDNVIWHGHTPNEETRKIIADSDLFFFTSLLDATSTVIFEALQSNTPVLCHDTCGFGNIIDNSCGVKIPLKDPKTSIERFSDIIDGFVKVPEKLNILKEGCPKKLKHHYWDVKALQMVDIYKACIKN